MDEKKQIEEMAKDIELSYLCLGYAGLYMKGGFDEVARFLYKSGYRKQSEGEWIYHECVSSYDGAISGYSCSCCSAFVHEEVYEDTSFPNKFCPNCGAKMKGGEGK